MKDVSTVQFTDVKVGKLKILQLKNIQSEIVSTSRMESIDRCS